MNSIFPLISLCKIKVRGHASLQVRNVPITKKTLRLEGVMYAPGRITGSEIKA